MENNRLTGRYRGEYLEPLKSKKKRRKEYSHPIFLYSSDSMGDRESELSLSQIVNVYEHTSEDFEFNAEKISKHFRDNYNSSSMALYTLGQSITFRVYKGQKEPYALPLFTFLLNYTMIIPLILLGVDMKNWKPWRPPALTSSAWRSQMNQYITMCRGKANMRRVCECLSESKYAMNMWAVVAGDRLALSISNNDFIEVAKRNRDAYESLTCSFDIPDDISPTELERISGDRTKQLLNYIGEQIDLPISTYARNGLFNPGQFREFAVHICFKPDLYGNTIEFTNNTNIIMGLKDPIAHYIDAMGGRKAEILKLSVSDAGAFERALCMTLSSLERVDPDYECDSKHFRTRTVDSAETLDKLDGRVATLDPMSDEYFIVTPNSTHLIGKTLKIKTPITCTHPDRDKGVICSACYGKIMANLNCDIHIGRLAALNLADNVQQKLLSAKHALATDTNNIKFDPIFDSYFVAESCKIEFNSMMIDASAEGDDEFNHMYLEFHNDSITKRQDGEGRHLDKSIPEIIIYDDRDDTRITITEENGTRVFLSQELNDIYLDAAQHKNAKDTVRIPFTDLIDGGTVLCDVLFEYQYKNNDIPSAMKGLIDTLSNKGNIGSYDTYDGLLDAIRPLFVRGGIHLPEYQAELLVSQLLWSPDGKRVDWEEENPPYTFYTINKSIQNNDSVLISLLYQETSNQLAGAYNAYNKTGVSAHDYFLQEQN